MKNKGNGLRIKSFRGDFITYYNLPKRKADKSHLRKLLTTKELKQIDKDFEDFFKLISENSVDESSVELFKNFKEEIKLNYYNLLWREIAFHPMRKAKQVGNENVVEDLFNDKKLRESLLVEIKLKLFFFADIVLAFVLGNDTLLKNMIEKHKLMSGKKINPINLEHYKEILNIYSKLLKKYKTGHRCSLTAAVNHYNNTNKLFWNMKKCKSVRETISKLVEKGALQYPA